MKPIDIVAEMLVCALKTNSSHASLAVVFLIMSRVIGELPGDNTHLTDWMDQSISFISRSNKDKVPSRGASLEV
jgi:hypothetical protein